MCIINDDHMMYGSWDMECDKQNVLSFWAIFCPFTSLNNPENQNLKKMKKKTPVYNIILHTGTVNNKHMMYGSWDIECNRQNFSSPWTIFLPFYPTSNPKNQTFEKWKNSWTYHVTKVYQKYWSHATLFTRYGTLRI